MRFIGIDPGKSGGIAWLGEGEDPQYALLKNMTDQDVWRCLARLEMAGAYAVVEKVHSSPQMGVKSAFTFGRGYGFLVASLTASAIPFVEVTPNKWQKSLSCQTKGDKNVTKQKAQQLYPSLKVTHGNADALLIATYCRQNVSDLF